MTLEKASSISTGHMSDRTQKFCDLNLNFCKNGISFAFPGTRTCGLKFLWVWVAYEIFSCLVYWWGTISYDYCIYWSKLLPQQFSNSIMIFNYQVLCKQYDCLQVRHLWDQKIFSGKSNTCFYDQVSKQLFYDPLHLHHSCHCCRAWWF